MEHDRFLVGAEGQPPVEVFWQAGDRRILSFAGRFVPLDAPAGIPPALRALCPRPERSGLAAGGETGFRVAFPGRYRLQWWALAAAEGKAVEWVEIPVADPLVLEVLAPYPGPVAGIALDQSEVERALASPR